MEQERGTQERFILQPANGFYRISRQAADEDFDPPIWVERERLGPFSSREQARLYMLARSGA